MVQSQVARISSLIIELLYKNYGAVGLIAYCGGSEYFIITDFGGDTRSKTAPPSPTLVTNHRFDELY